MTLIHIQTNGLYCLIILFFKHATNNFEHYHQSWLQSLTDEEFSVDYCLASLFDSPVLWSFFGVQATTSVSVNIKFLFLVTLWVPHVMGPTHSRAGCLGGSVRGRRVKEVVGGVWLCCCTVCAGGQRATREWWWWVRYESTYRMTIDDVSECPMCHFCTLSKIWGN